MKFKKLKFLFIGVIGSLATISLVSFFAVKSALNHKKNSVKVISNSNVTTNLAAVNPRISNNVQVSNFSSDLGPVIISNDNIMQYSYDGTIVWTLTIASPIIASKYAPNSQVLYVINSLHELSVIDLSNGSIVNKTKTLNDINALSLLSSGSIFAYNQFAPANNLNGTLYWLNALTLEQKPISSVGLGLSNNDYIVNILSLTNNLNLVLYTTVATGPVGSDTLVNNLHFLFANNDFSKINTSEINLTINLNSLSVKFNDFDTNLFYSPDLYNYVLVLPNELIPFNTYSSDDIYSALNSATPVSYGSGNILNSVIFNKKGSGSYLFLKYNSLANQTSSVYSYDFNTNTISKYVDLTTSFDGQTINPSSYELLVNELNPNSPFLVDATAPDNQKFIGILAKDALYSTFIYNPNKIMLNQSATSTSLASEVNSSDFTYNGAGTLESVNVTYYNNSTGQFTAKSVVSVPAWFNTSQQIKIIFYSDFVVPTVLKTRVRWMPQQLLPASLTSIVPSSITPSELLSIPEFITLIVNGNDVINNSDVSFLITSANDETGQISIKAIINYVDKFGQNMQVDISNSYSGFSTTANYDFELYGGDSSSQTPINSIPQLKQFQSYLPSLVTITDLSKFIKTSIGYPIAAPQRVAFMIPNDNLGTLTVGFSFNGIPAQQTPPVPTTFEHTYTGFLTSNQMAFKWAGESSFPTVDQPSVISVKDVSSLSKYANMSPFTIATGLPVTNLYFGNKPTTNTKEHLDLAPFYSTPLTNMGIVPKIDILTATQGMGQYVDDIDKGNLTIELDYSNQIPLSIAKQLGFGYKNNPYAVAATFTDLAPIKNFIFVHEKPRDSSAIQNFRTGTDDGAELSKDQLLGLVDVSGFNLDNVITSYKWYGGNVDITYKYSNAVFPSLQNQILTVKLRTVAYQNWINLTASTSTIIPGIAIIVAIALFIWWYSLRTRVRRNLK